MNALVPSAGLIRRSVDMEVDYTRRMRVLERLEGNPVGVFYRKVGKSGWARMARHLPVPSFNAVVGRPADRAACASAALRGGTRRGLRLFGCRIPLIFASQYGACRNDAAIRPRAVDAALSCPNGRNISRW
jgi:hypothetical protein